jgi:hypothetical protein
MKDTLNSICLFFPITLSNRLLLQEEAQTMTTKTKLRKTQTPTYQVHHNRNWPDTECRSRNCQTIFFFKKKKKKTLQTRKTQSYMALVNVVLGLDVGGNGEPEQTESA